MKIYRTVVFLDSAVDFDTWFSEHDEDRREGLAFLLQWEYGETGEVSMTPPWGSDERTEEWNVGGLTYVVAWHWGLSHVSLTEVLEGQGPNEDLLPVHRA